MSALGYRGYVASRPFFGERAPQHVQNIVINNYCSKNNLRYLLSATEVAMPGMYLILEQVLQDHKNIDGIIFYSLFQLPEERPARQKILKTAISNRIDLHFAVESMRVASEQEAVSVDQVFSIQKVLLSPQYSNNLSYIKSSFLTADQH